jgi:nicotinic acid mononucleotide adenylyltransferase
VVVWRGTGPALLPPAIEARLGLTLAQRIERGILRLPPVHASARELRERLARGESPAELPPGVLEYVRAHGLYSALA